MFRLWVGSLLGAFGSVWMVVVLHDGGSDDITSTGAVVDLLNLVVRTGWTTGRPFALKERRRRRTDGVGPGTTKSSLSHSMIATFFFAFGTSLNLGPPIMLDIRPVCWCACCTPPNSRVNMGNPGSMLSLSVGLCCALCGAGPGTKCQCGSHLVAVRLLHPKKFQVVHVCVTRRLLWMFFKLRKLVPNLGRLRFGYFGSEVSPDRVHSLSAPTGFTAANGRSLIRQVGTI